MLSSLNKRHPKKDLSLTISDIMKFKMDVC